MSASSYPRAAWRLLISPAIDGATNMAIDEAIVRAVTAGVAPSTLRLYAWDPPCLSLGRGQSGDEVDRTACVRGGVHVVRRPTGGRAILHTDELTYSVIAPADDERLTGDIITSYRRLSRALLAALRHLGIDSDARNDPEALAEPKSGERNPNPVCFEVPSHYELTTADGRKLIGSAQMRTHHTVLQHGTLPLAGDIARICRYLVDAPAPQRVRGRAATLESVLGRPVAWAEVCSAMAAGFTTALNVALVLGVLTTEEQAWADELHDAKYANDGWTWRV